MTREEAIERIEQNKAAAEFYAQMMCKSKSVDNELKDIETFNMAIEALKAKMDGDMGEVSDGYHTFNQLYHQRAVLFATIVKQNKEKAWKSWKHGDGKFCFDSNKEWFIVGVDTPEGSYTYHYEKKYWDMFDCVELERGKFWDGHTEDDVTRLLSLQSADSNANQHVGSVDLISRQDAINVVNKHWYTGTNVCKADATEREIIMLPSADRPTVDKEYLIDLIQEAVYDGENCAKLMDMVDRPTGEWVEAEVLPEVYDIEGVKTWGSEMQCDQCGFRFTAIEGHITQYNFCPNCGSYNGGKQDV